MYKCKTDLKLMLQWHVTFCDLRIPLALIGTRRLEMCFSMLLDARCSMLDARSAEAFSCRKRLTLQKLHRQELRRVFQQDPAGKPVTTLMNSLMFNPFLLCSLMSSFFVIHFLYFFYHFLLYCTICFSGLLCVLYIRPRALSSQHVVLVVITFALTDRKRTSLPLPFIRGSDSEDFSKI